MQIYLVGGAVRDHLLAASGQAPSPNADRDWVVVGSSPEALLAQGFVAVGKDFPVFLHPQTREEYALARTERKTSAGYKGFVVHASPDVTLEEDLARRDLTINAMALPAEQVANTWGEANIIDPFNGLADLKNGTLRHVTDAFKEDPVRLLRIARFAARWPHMRIAPDTLALMRSMVQAGEADALVAERVWQEASRALMSQKPSRFFNVLRDCGALAAVGPEIDGLWTAPSQAPDTHTIANATMQVIDHCARIGADLSVRFACLCRSLSAEVGPAAAQVKGLSARWRAPHDCSQLAELLVNEQRHLQESDRLPAADLVQLLERCDAFRRPERFENLLQASACVAHVHAHSQASPAPNQAPHLQLRKAWEAANQVDSATLARQLASELAGQAQLGARIGEAVHAARVAAVEQALRLP